MFEKFSISDIDSAGRGGEYTVQAGFGWTNGVVLWIASTYGNVLDAPTCPNITVSESTNTGQSSSAFRIGASPGSITAVAILAIAVSGMMF